MYLVRKFILTSLIKSRSLFNSKLKLVFYAQIAHCECNVATMFLLPMGFEIEPLKCERPEHQSHELTF